jgi:hypothetical protein
MKRNKVKGCNGEFRHHINNSLFNFYVCFEGSPPAEEQTLWCYARGGAPPILYVPMERFLFYETGKKEVRKSKASCFVCVRGGFILVHSLKIQEHPNAHTLRCPSLRRTHS